MTTQASPPPAAPSIRPSPTLATRDEVLAWLRAQIADSSLTEVALRYDLSPSQISDVVNGRANLSRRMLGRLRWKLIEFYQKLDGKPGGGK
jgi:putative SOS response-associated peptidase YedK